MNWKDTVTDPDEVKVFLALDGPQYTWRTTSGIARQTGLSEEKVAAILKKYNQTLARSRADSIFISESTTRTIGFGRQ